MGIKREEWKYIINELMIKYGTENIIQELNISKPALYKWLQGNSSKRVRNLSGQRSR